MFWTLPTTHSGEATCPRTGTSWTWGLLLRISKRWWDIFFSHFNTFPILYSLYIPDLPLHLKHKVNIFSSNTPIFLRSWLSGGWHGITANLKLFRCTPMWFLLGMTFPAPLTAERSHILLQRKVTRTFFFACSFLLISYWVSFCWTPWLVYSQTPHSLEAITQPRTGRFIGKSTFVNTHKTTTIYSSAWKNVVL